MHNELPRYIQDRLISPPKPVGNRHRDILNLSIQILGEGLSQSETVKILKARYPDKPEDEIAKAVAWCASKNPQPTLRKFQLSPHVPSADIPDLGISAPEFLKIVFKEGETVCICKEAYQKDGRWQPANSGIFKTREEWIAILEKHPTLLDGEAGAWVRINPFKPDAKHGNDSEVSAFRHLLVEFDRLEKQKQWQVMYGSAVPLSTVTDSADKSYHGLIRVEADSPEQFKERQKEVYSYLSEYIDDESNVNPSRFSRLPGVMRGHRKQKLLAVNLGALNYQAWQEGLDLPKEMTVKGLLGYNQELDNSCLIGDNYITKGSSLLIVGQSGIGKSSLIMQMVITFALGDAFFGLQPTQPLKSCIIQAENPEGDLAKPIQDMVKAMKISEDQIHSLNDRISLFEEAGKTGAEFAGLLNRIIKRKQPDIVVCDPLLSYIGGNINEQETVSRFLRNQIQPIINATGVLLVFVHHTGKPSNYRGGTDRDKDYSFLGSSEILNWTREIITLSEIWGSPGVCELRLGKRWKRANVYSGGQKTNRIKLQQSQDKILWEEWKIKELGKPIENNDPDWTDSY